MTRAYNRNAGAYVMTAIRAGWVTSAEIAKATGVSARVTRTILKKLCASGRAQREYAGKVKGYRYTRATSLPPQ